MSSLPVSMKKSHQEQPRKRGNAVFQIITLSVAMETSGRIWPNFELIQASMHVLIACKYEKDQMKNSGENVMTCPFQVLHQFSKRQEDVLQTYWTSSVYHVGHVGSNT